MRDICMLGVNVKRITKRTGFYILIVALCLVVFLPILWTINVAIKSPMDLMREPFSIVFTPTLQNFRAAIDAAPIGGFFMNSLIIATLTALITLLIVTPGAYVVARFGIGGQFLKRWVLSIWFLPPIVAAIPIFLVLLELRLLDTHIGLIIPYMLLTIPFAFLLLSSFIAGVPEEIEQAALVDGCSRGTAFWRIILPLSLPGFLVTFAFCFMFAWNEYFFALIISGTAVRTMPVHITAYLSIHTIGWGEAASVSLLIAAPMLILLIVIQKNLVEGLTLGALD